MGQKIYIADDESSVLDVLSAFLLREGFAVETFTEGEALISACEWAVPDLVILDIMMPKMDGFCTCTVLRANHPHLPIIFISSKDSPYDQTMGLCAGGNDYIKKPFLPSKLAARIRALLEPDRDTGSEPTSDTDRQII